MNKIFKSAMVLFTVGLVAITSCKKKEPEPIIETVVKTDTIITIDTIITTDTVIKIDTVIVETPITTVDQDKENIRQSLNEVVTCIDEVQSGRLVSLIQSAFSIEEGVSKNGEGEWLEALADSLGEIMVDDFDQVETNERFNLSDFATIYTYNKTSKTWDSEASTNGSFVLNFPSQDGGDNDLQFVASRYSDKAFLFENETVYLPTDYKVTFSQNGERLIELELNSIQYEQLPNIAIPIYIDMDVYMAPLSMNLTARKVNDVEFDLNVSVTNGAGCDLELFGEIKLKHDDYENLVEEDVDYINGFIRHNDLKITTNINFDELARLNDPTTLQVNINVNTDVFYQDEKIGDLEIDDINARDPRVFIRYKDGTFEDVDQTYLVPFLENLETTVFGLTGDWDEAS